MASDEQSADLEEKSADNCYVALTHAHLDIPSIIDRVRSPKAGAIVLFAGTTRDNFHDQPVRELEYTAYKPRALQTMLAICHAAATAHALTGIAMVHRLGVVPIGEESILIAVASPHRQAAWRAGEEALEECKRRVEVWKKEAFEGPEQAVWRANRDGAAGVRVDEGVVGGGEVGRGEGEGEAAVEPDVSFAGVTEEQVRPFRNIMERGHGPVVHPKR